MDFYGYNEFYDDDSTGVTTPLIPADKMILGNPGTRAERHYGAIQDLEAVGRPIVGVADYFPKMWLNPNPSTWNVMLQSSPLPVPHEIDAFACIDIL